ncbi:efflux RND transporter periplasmic adaptor subunit [Terriglobus saanensis]|uniref:Efflux transporter, RND family, MFP subunit n=1 Tax=Terriglobus saanensis (strain ATCC BAA-1853 / DSM 23119 / SP1PR4) TaxID=401053 RepID=E8V8F2_TERSS|nr:efflux RND transporter periplasmic adaptor subunit [Terriglobus saanensis]ADV82931.1 efflux transporter, RND family, MFP subunit [Terriglobus saanensis SP1PR4]
MTIRNQVLRACAVILFVLPLLVAQGCKAKPEESAVAQNVGPNEVTIPPALAGNLKFGSPEMRNVTGLMQVAAHVETDASRIARVGSPVSGRILRLLVFEGQNVKAGTALAMLHSTDLSDAQVALIKSGSQQGLAAASVKRAEQLVEADVIGRAELERRRAEQLQASTEVSSYRTQLRGLGMTENQIHQLETNRKLSADYPIVTPKGGTVLKREITIGQVVQPSDPAFTIADLSSVWIVANVPEEDAGTLRKGMEVTVKIPALPQEEITGRLSFVSPIVDPATRTVAVRMEMKNTEGRLKPDELASMIFTGHADRKLTIPNTATVREDNRDHVFVQIAPQKYLLREVQLGEEQDDRRVVLGGVRADERIVTDGAFHLNNQRKQNAIKGGQ